MASSGSVDEPPRTLGSLASPGQIIDPTPLIRDTRSWTRVFGPMVSFLILLAVAYQFRALDIAKLVRLIPFDPAFWAVFAIYYLAQPLSEWVIFRRLWRLPIEGLGALLRKLVSNELLLGYLGEVYFYAWARRNARVPMAPFGAIKDVTILSALTGNVVTLIMVVVAMPLFRLLHVGMDSTAFVASMIFLLLSSLAALLLRRRLFTLPREALWFVTVAHTARIVITTVLAAMMWHLLLPSVGLSWWVLLGTLRQLVSRLPFVPNKDVVFAGVAAFLVGSETGIVSAMALMATLILCAHLLVGAMLGITDLARETQG